MLWTAFYLKPSDESIKHNATIYLSQYGGDAAPAYTLRHPDPASPESKNRYAAALYDCYYPDILFGEVLLIPEWSYPTPSPEDLRRNGGIPPPPQPILPQHFDIQLYNPDQQVRVKHRPATWNSAACWEFEMPVQTFRQPSISALDRIQSDPTASNTTPQINFKWKRDGKLSKDLICNLSGKSSNPDGSKRKNKEPDIPVAYFRHLREITIYEPNLSRVDMEDPKGLEVVFMLSAAVIRDVYFGHMKEAFNISEDLRRGSAGVAQRTPPLSPDGVAFSHIVSPSQKLPQDKQERGSHHHHNRSQDSDRPPLRVQTSNPRPPPTDPRSQWEIDVETARLQKQVEHEERERKRAERAETKRIKAMVEAEEREARRKQAEIDKETERLRRVFEAEKRHLNQSTRKPGLPPRHSYPQQYQYPPQQYQYPPQQYQYPPQQSKYWPAQQQPSYQQGPGGYLQAPGGPSSSGRRSAEPRVKPKRSSFFGFRSNSDDEVERLQKQKSLNFR